MTNYEKIKDMSVEEMAEFFAKRHFEELNRILEGMGQEPMNECLLRLAFIGKRKWLESEAEKK